MESEWSGVLFGDHARFSGPERPQACVGMKGIGGTLSVLPGTK